jgi:predicted NUDIX family NTP pyrophosphohydrolase
MAEKSAGVLLYRRTPRLEVLLVHPGGPFWAKKDDGAWSLPKGLIDAHEDAEAAARREFEEETGTTLEGAMTELGAFKQPSGKIVHAFAMERDLDVAIVRSNDFEMEWPPKSGRKAKFPEVDRAGWFTPARAEIKIVKGQQPIIAALRTRLGVQACETRSPGSTRTDAGSTAKRRQGRPGSQS